MPLAADSYSGVFGFDLKLSINSGGRNGTFSRSYDGKLNISVGVAGDEETSYAGALLALSNYLAIRVASASEQLWQ